MKHAIENYLSYLKLANRSVQTVRSYGGYLRDFARILNEVDDPATLGIEHIERYLFALHQRDLAKASVRRALATVKSFCRWLVGESVLQENPCDFFRGPRRSVRMPHQRASEAEIRALMDSPISGPTMTPRGKQEGSLRVIRGKWYVSYYDFRGIGGQRLHPQRLLGSVNDMTKQQAQEEAKLIVEKVNDSPARKAAFTFPERDRLILELLYGSGLRCDECANLRVDDFIEPDKLVVSKGKGNKERYVFLTDAALSVLRAYLEKRQRILANRMQHGDVREITALFFGLSGAQINALSTRHVYRIVVKYAKNAGLAWLSPHDLRRAFATHMDEHGAPHVVISRLLGHAKLSTTDLYIAKASLERLKAAYACARMKSRNGGVSAPETRQHPQNR